MFDDIKLEIDCPRCGTKVGNFQSKDGPCLMATLDFWEVNYFYSSCPKCKVWIKFNRKRKMKPAPVPLTDFKMEVKDVNRYNGR